MSIEEDRQQALNDIQNIATAINEISPDAIFRYDLGKELNFEEIKPTYESAQELINRLKNADLSYVPYKKLHEARGALSNIFGLLSEITKFSIKNLEGADPINARSSLLRKVREGIESYFDRIALLIAFGQKLDKHSIAKELGDDLLKLFSEAIPEQVKELDKVIQEQRERRDAMLKEIDSTLANVRKAAGEVGVKEHAMLFQKQAREHQINGRYWLVATSAAVAATLIYAIGNFYYYLNLPSNTVKPELSASIQIGIAKLVIFAILYFAILWSARIYKSHCHNYVVNKHRQNSLSTFEAFVAAAKGDEATKNAVLLQATQSIFTHQQSGFVGGDPDPNPSPQILQMIGDLTKIKS